MPTIKTQLASQLANEQVGRRQALLLQLRAILFLTRQGIALRGHTESESNLTQLMHMWAIHTIYSRAILKKIDTRATKL